MIYYEVSGTRNGDEVSAVSNGEKIGYLRFHVSEDICTIDELFVSKSFRGKRIGSMLVLKFWDYITRETQVVMNEVFLPRPMPEFERFLKKFNFYKDNEIGNSVEFSAAKVLESSFIAECREDNKCVHLSQIRTSAEVESLKKLISRSGWDIDIMDLFRTYDQRCSIIKMSGDEAVGFALVKKLEEGRVLLAYVYLDEGYRTSIAQMLRKTVISIQSVYGENAIIETFPAEADGLNLLKRIVPEYSESGIVRYYQYIK